MRTLLSRLSIGVVLAGLAALVTAPLRAAEEPVVIPPPAVDAQPATGLQTAVLAGGCFWGVQGVFQHTKGVVSAVSGYSGGAKSTAKYSLIGSGTTPSGTVAASTSSGTAR